MFSDGQQSVCTPAHIAWMHTHISHKDIQTYPPVSFLPRNTSSVGTTGSFFVAVCQSCSHFCSRTGISVSLQQNRIFFFCYLFEEFRKKTYLEKQQLQLNEGINKKAGGFWRITFCSPLEEDLAAAAGEGTVVAA